MFKVGIAGLGTVGAGVVEILEDQFDRFSQARTEVRVVGVSARSRDVDRGIDTSSYTWFENPVELARNPEIDILVEVIGGEDGPALETVETALSNGKHVVTANKSLLAKHGIQLAILAEQNGVSLCYEAAVAAGVPVIRTLRESVSASKVQKVTGILNGTCNYILSEMFRTGAAYEDALLDAQKLGYAEADPALDVGGMDAAHKLSIIAMLAFNSSVSPEEFQVSGIEKVSAADIEGARNLGYRIKLLAIAERNDPICCLRVHPALVHENQPIAHANGADNYVQVQSVPLGNLVVAGPGAGKGATAAGVVADVIAIARGNASQPVFGVPATQLKRIKPSGSEDQARFFVRFALRDVPGAVAGISETLAQHDISIDSLVQPSVSEAEKSGASTQATLVLTTHQTTEARILHAAEVIQEKTFALSAPSIIRIEEFNDHI